MNRRHATSPVAPFPDDGPIRGCSRASRGLGVLLAATWLGHVASAQQFGPAELLTGHTWGAKSVHAADLDGDGDQDVVTASMEDDKISWFENTDGLGTFAPKQVISAVANLAWRVHTSDLDGDGDEDVLSASAFDDKLAWYENTDGRGSFGAERIISTAGDSVVSVFTSDLDGDGDPDVLSASLGDDEVAWYENVDGLGTFGPQQLITATAAGAQTVFAADLDGDGDPDVLSASEDDDTIAWYENQDGLGGFGARQTVSTSADRAYSVFAADMDGDGDLDVLSASIADDKLAWYANTDGLGSFGPEQVVSLTPDEPVDVFATDMDGDGDADVLSASRLDDGIAWYENLDGLGTFAPPQVVSSTAMDARGVSAADLDGDGDPDVLSASYFDSEVAWYENLDGLGSLGPERLLSTSANSANSVFTSDLDGDGDFDVLSTSSIDDKLAWYENETGLGSFGPQRVISIAANLWPVLAADLDGDLDPDVLSPSGDTVVWYENEDGVGSFGPGQTLLSGTGGASSSLTADLDGDLDPDFLYASSTTNEIAWFENTDGLGGFGAKQIISPVVVPRSVSAADLDGDGDLDVVSASSGDDRVAWYENTDGLGSFGPQQVIATPGSETSAYVLAADLDGDGDQDVIHAYDPSSPAPYRLVWHENTDGLGSFGPERFIDLPFGLAFSNPVSAPDLDGDGDRDILLTYFFFVSTIAWYENTDGLGTFGPAQVVTSAVGSAAWARTTDLDGDGDADVLVCDSQADRVAWHANLACCALSVDADTISLATGGTQVISLDAGVQKGFDLYYVLTTATGTSPGLSQSPAPLKLPLNFSFLLLFTAQYPNSLVIPSLSFLSGAGTANATLTLPAGMDPGLAGITLHHAYVLLDLAPFAISGISNPVPLHLVP